MVLISASVERVGVSRMRVNDNIDYEKKNYDFFKGIKVSKVYQKRLKLVVKKIFV